VDARLFRLMMRLYPPYVGAGIRVTELDREYRRLRVEMPLRWFNRNYVGTHFGGSLASMTDPFYMLLLLNRLGPGYTVWDLQTTIRFKRPGRATVHAVFEIDDERLASVREATAGGAKFTPTWPVAIRSADGELVAEVDKTLYVRKKV
jgi:acyl-coenzyme A thioesterase PaaI-like protein